MVRCDVRKGSMGGAIRFWEAIAGECAGNPAVFCYDLMNEPFIAGGPRKPGTVFRHVAGWVRLHSVHFTGYGGRPRDQVAGQWIATLTAAIRRRDAHHLITVGLLPWVKNWGFLSGFVPQKGGAAVDFVAVHIYPEPEKRMRRSPNLKKFAVGKPVVVEDIYPFLFRRG